MRVLSLLKQSRLNDMSFLSRLDNFLSIFFPIGGKCLCNQNNARDFIGGKHQRFDCLVPDSCRRYRTTAVLTACWQTCLLTLLTVVQQRRNSINKKNIFRDLSLYIVILAKILKLFFF